MSLLIYGANGFTGQLIVEECVRRGLRPILAGRRADALVPLARQHGLEVRVASLFSGNDPGRPRLTPPGTLPPLPHDELLTMLDGVSVVLHCAGPFFRTSGLMVQACLEVGAHYLDITGEITVFEACRQRHAAARQRDIVILPGVGFDVVPTDCLAARLAAFKPKTRPEMRGYVKLHAAHVTQADQGCDFDYLETSFGAQVPEPVIY